MTPQNTPEGSKDSASIVEKHVEKLQQEAARLKNNLVGTLTARQSLKRKFEDTKGSVLDTIAKREEICAERVTNAKEMHENQHVIARLQAKDVRLKKKDAELVSQTEILKDMI